MNTYFGTFFKVIASFLFLAPLRVLAATGGTVSGGSTRGTVSNDDFSDIPLIDNPISGVSSFSDLVAKVLELVVQIGIPIAGLFLMWAGLKYVMARGNDTEIKKAREMLINTLLGIAILLGAQLIASAIGTTIKELQ